MNHIADFIEIVPAYFDDKLGRLFAVLIESSPQDVQRVAIGVAGVKPNSCMHRGACDLHPFIKGNGIIAQARRTVNVWRKIFQERGLLCRLGHG